MTSYARIAACLTVAGFASAPGGAEVVEATAPGFITRTAITVATPPAATYTRFLEIGRWWSDAHTYSGRAANMSLAATPAGCFCETLPDGGFIEHGRVIHVAPGKLLRLSAPLGPLHELGGAGSLAARFETADEGTRVTLEFTGMGYEPRKGLAPLAPLYDEVLTEAMQRFKRYVEARAPAQP